MSQMSLPLLNKLREESDRDFYDIDTDENEFSDGFRESTLISWQINVNSENTLKGAEAHIKAEDVDFQRVNVLGKEYTTMPSEEKAKISYSILQALSIRQKYMTMSLQDFNKTAAHYLDQLEKSKTAIDLFDNIQNFDIISYKNVDTSNSDLIENDEPPNFDEWPIKLGMSKGVIEMKIDEIEDEELKHTCQEIIESIPHIKRSEFIHDFKFLKHLIADGPNITYCFKRLSFINSKFQMHVLLNEELEADEQKDVPHRDFYNVRKVDNHIHAASSMNQKHLLRFIKKSVKSHSDMKVCINKETQTELGLGELFETLNITCYDLNVDNLSVHADSNTFHRFDKFNLKYNPVGVGELREVFLKTSNLCDGIFFAQILKEVFQDLEESKYQYTEMRLSIYGKSPDEWDELAKWVEKHEIKSPQNKWIIQIPRLYDVFKSKEFVQSFQDILHNVFIPLFEVTCNTNSHPELHRFLFDVSSIDSVDDESKVEIGPMYKNIQKPDEWTQKDNPSYDYYIYYLYINVMKLNNLRRKRRLPILKLRPHCGEAGPIYHLIVGYMLAENINHGLLLRKSPVLQYLYYLCQVGVAMSPLSNNSLFLTYHRNPLPHFLGKGLKVSISTDDPLQFHFTKEPLMEEYSIAAQVWKLTPTDMCELARNSILMSGFSDKLKRHWLGKNYQEEGLEGNDIHFTNVPNVRVAFRFETLIGELINLLISIVSKESSIVIRREPKETEN